MGERVCTVGGNQATRPITDFLLNECPGKIWYVNSAGGIVTTTSGNGKSWNYPFLTIAEAVAVASAGDTILCKGSFSEAVTVSLAGLKIINVGTGPADAVWTAPTVAGSFCLYLNAANLLVYGFKFRPVVYTSSGIPSGIKLGSAPYARILNNRFQGQANSYCGVYAPADTCDNVELSDNEFIYMNTLTNGYAIYGVAASNALFSSWKIKNNTFNSCTNDIVLPGRNCLLEGNKHFINGVLASGAIGAVTTGKAINLSGTGAGGNLVTKCTLGGAYTNTLYQQATGDVWMGNYAAITSATAPNGLTVAYPAA